MAVQIIPITKDIGMFFGFRILKPFLTHSRPTLMETLPACCMPLAKLLTTEEQLLQVFLVFFNYSPRFRKLASFLNNLDIKASGLMYFSEPFKRTILLYLQLFTRVVDGAFYFQGRTHIEEDSDTDMIIDHRELSIGEGTSNNASAASTPQQGFQEVEIHNPTNQVKRLKLTDQMKQ